MHQINTFQQVSAKQSIWQWLHPLRCYRKSTWFWHFFVIKPHFSPNRKIITAQCYARYLTRAWWSQQTDQHFFRQFIFQRVAFERRPILLASRLPQYQRLAHLYVKQTISLQHLFDIILIIWLLECKISLYLVSCLYVIIFVCNCWSLCVE